MRARNVKFNISICVASNDASGPKRTRRSRLKLFLKLFRHQPATQDSDAFFLSSIKADLSRIFRGNSWTFRAAPGVPVFFAMRRRAEASLIPGLLYFRTLKRKRHGEESARIQTRINFRLQLATRHRVSYEMSRDP